jgi:hypothetical protein
MIDLPSWPLWNNQPIVLFHGTLAEFAHVIHKEGIDISRGRPNTDFGRGFYTTTVHSQAVVWAEQVRAESGQPHAVLQLTLDRLALRSLRHLAFILGTPGAVDYWSFVSHCRRKNQRWPGTDQDYDVVYGPVARFWAGPEKSEVFQGYDQISFHSSRAQRMLRNPKLCQVEVMK